MKRTVTDFLAGFVLPLVRGGELQVHKPISEPELRLMADDLPHASVPMVQIDDARTEVCAELVVRAPALVLDEDELSLAASLHNLLFLSHPDAESWSVTRSMERRVLDTARHLAKRPMSMDRRRVLARHGLLHNLFHISRTDVRLRWWTGSATFFGQSPPKRLTSWKSLRRVTEEKAEADFGELLGAETIAPVVLSLIRRSPLTMLLSPERVASILHWEELVFILRDSELARAVAYMALRGSSPEQIVSAPACYAAGFEQMLERRGAQADIRAVSAFLVHLNALLAVSEADDRDVRRSALLNAVLAPSRAGARPRGLSTFFALPAALAAVDPRLAEPPGLDSDPRVRARWNQHREQIAQSVGDAVIEALSARLSRHLQAARAAG